MSPSIADPENRVGKQIGGTPQSAFCFFVLAFALTFALNQLPPFTVAGVDLKSIVCGFGPLLSGIVCYKFFRTPNTHRISVGGVKPALTYSLVALAVLLPLLHPTKMAKSALLVVLVSEMVYSFGGRIWLAALPSECDRAAQKRGCRAPDRHNLVLLALLVPARPDSRSHRAIDSRAGRYSVVYFAAVLVVADVWRSGCQNKINPAADYRARGHEVRRSLDNGGCVFAVDWSTSAVEPFRQGGSSLRIIERRCCGGM